MVLRWGIIGAGDIAGRGMSPALNRAAQAVQAAEAGKHVLCEKPMATTVRDAERMIVAQAVHPIDLLRFLLGAEVEEVQAMTDSAPDKMVRLAEDFNKSVVENTELGVSGYNGLQMVRMATALQASSRLGKAVEIG